MLFPRLLLLVAVAGLGCGTWYSEVRLDSAGISDEYAEALVEHTKRGWRSRGFDNLVTVTATIHAESFLDSLRSEKARLHSPPGTQGDGALDALMENGELSVLVFIEALEPGWERLDRGEPVWRLFLEVGGVRHRPSSITAVDPRDATLSHLFPYVTRFGRAWLVEFPVDDAGPRPVLWMVGAPAQLRLEFELAFGAGT